MGETVVPLAVTCLSSSCATVIVVDRMLHATDLVQVNPS